MIASGGGLGEGRAPLERQARGALAALDRRGFLRLAGTMAVAGMAPTGCGGGPSWLAPPADTTLHVLTPRTYAVFTAACARFAGPRVAELIAAGRMHPGRAADDWLARSPDVAAPLGQGLLLLEFGGWPLIAKLRPFTALDGDAQDRVLDELLHSRLVLKRTLWRGVRSFAMLAVYLAPEARALTAFPGPFGSAGVTIGDAMVPVRG